MASLHSAEPLWHQQTCWWVAARTHLIVVTLCMNRMQYSIVISVNHSSCWERHSGDRLFLARCHYRHKSLLFSVCYFLSKNSRHNQPMIAEILATLWGNGILQQERPAEGLLFSFQPCHYGIYTWDPCKLHHSSCCWDIPVVYSIELLGNWWQHPSPEHGAI